MNTVRSVMAAAILRHLAGQRFQVCSAGVRSGALHPLAVAAMGEVGIDISGQRSKNVDEYAGSSFDYVITVCDHAHEHCPVFPGNAKRLHTSFDDPPRLAAQAKDAEEALAHYRRVRDEIRSFVAGLPESLLER